jgi:uncharacterized spore protein YtfJ
MAAKDLAYCGRTRLGVEAKEVFRSIRETLSARQVFGEAVARDGVTVIPAATVIGTGGGGGGTRTPGKEDGEADRQATGAGMGLGMIAWPSGAFEIRDDRVTWRPTVDITRIAFAGLGVVLALGIGTLAARRRS